MTWMLRCSLVTLLIAVAAGSMHAQERAAVVSQASRSFCAGRLLVDIPRDSNAVITAVYHNVEVNNPAQIRSLDAWKAGLEGRAKSLSSTNMVRNDYKDKILKSAGVDPTGLYGKTQLVGFEMDDSSQRALLGYQPDPNKPDLLVEVYKLIHEMDYKFSSKGLGANAYSQVKSGLLAAVNQFEPASNYEAPNKPGFCVNGGVYIDGGRSPINERLTLVVSFPKHPDVQFTIDTNAIDQVNRGEPSLKERVDGDLAMMRSNYSGGVSVVERGQLRAVGQDGYQVGVSAPYDVVPGTHIRKFFWSADGVPNDVTRPFMEVDLTIQPTDDGKSTIKDDAEAKALWDSLIQAIRIRPGAAG